MEKRMNTKQFFLALSLVVGIFVSTASALDAENGYALLVQQSPPDAGSVTPASGVHSVQIGQTVSLSAVPKPGYRFLYWLGDVSAAGTSDTTIEIDSPKMVVAVFTREAYEEELPGVSLIKGAGSRSGGGGRLIGTPMSSPSSVSAGSYSEIGDIVYNFPDFDPDPDPDPDPDDDDVLVPGDETDDIPVPGEDGNEVPEPATILMLGLGSVVFLKRKPR